MTQPYPFTHTFTYTADTQHAKASAATRLRSSRLLGDVARLGSINGHETPNPDRLPCGPETWCHADFSRFGPSAAWRRLRSMRGPTEANLPTALNSQ